MTREDFLKVEETDETEFCTYCNGVHKMLDFGVDLRGNPTHVCSNRLSDALVQTMPKEDYGELESEEILSPKGGEREMEID